MSVRKVAIPDRLTVEASPIGGDELHVPGLVEAVHLDEDERVGVANESIEQDGVLGGQGLRMLSLAGPGPLR